MKLVERLPEHYRADPLMTVIQEALQPEVETLQEKRDETLEQLQLSKATWGLDRWERAHGVPTAPKRNAVQSKNLVRAKLMGHGPTTPGQVKAVAEGYTSLTVRVREHPPEEFCFDLVFVGDAYAPEGLEGLNEALDEIVPAHVGYGYIFIAAAGVLTERQGLALRVGRRVTFTTDKGGT